MRLSTWAGIAATACLWSGASWAQDFGLPGQVVLGAERLTGVYSDHVKTTVTNTGPDGTSAKRETTVDTTSISLLGVPAVLGDSAMHWPSSTPRLALDVFVAPGLSLGGSFIYMNRGGSQERKYTPSSAGTNDEQDLPSGTTILFSPRIGYAAQVSPSFAIWPRGGITYANYRLSEEETDPQGNRSTYKVSADFTTVSLEVMAVALAVPHFAILFGPFLDLPMGGSYKITEDGVVRPNSPKVSYWSVGASAGLAGYF